MTYLVLLKRFEVWLLLGVVAGILFFAFSPGEGPEIVEEEKAPDPVVLTDTLPEPVKDPSGDEPVQEDPALVVDQVRSEATEGGRIIEVTLSARSTNGEEVVADENAIRAMTDTGVTVPRFFAPFQEVGVIHPDDATRLRVKFWLAETESSEPASFLWLDFQGEKTQAKIPGNG